MAAVVYSTGAYHSIKLGDYGERAPLQQKVKALPYYRGSTYTDRALDMTKDLAMPESQTRSGVAKYVQHKLKHIASSKVLYRKQLFSK